MNDSKGYLCAQVLPGALQQTNRAIRNDKSQEVKKQDQIGETMMTNKSNSVEWKIPKIICMQNLFKIDEETEVIKIVGHSQSSKLPQIPFKNLSIFDLTFDVELISLISDEEKPFTFIARSEIACKPNSRFFVALQLQKNGSFTGKMPLKSFIRAILVLKIRGTSFYYHYPIEVMVIHKEK